MLTGVKARLWKNGANPRIAEVHSQSGEGATGGGSRTEIDPKTSRNKRIKIIVWAFALAFLCGMIDFGRPLEDIIQSGRDKIRSHPAPSDVVVIGIDDRTIAAFEGIDFPRRHFATALDQAFAKGAKAAYFDTAFAASTELADDEKLLSSFKRHRGKIWLGSIQTIGKNGSRELIEPTTRFRDQVHLVALNGKKSPFSISMRIPYSVTTERGVRQSVSASIANVNGERDTYFRGDWSIAFDTVPTIAMIDLVEGKNLPNLEGKTVIFGYTSNIGQDMHHIASQGWWPGVYFHVVAAQTLKRGFPVNQGWLSLLLLTLAVCVFCATRCKRTLFNAAAGGAFAVLLFLPLIADAYLVTFEIVPALIVLAICHYRLSALRKLEHSSATNRSSGLPNINVLRDQPTLCDLTLVCMRTGNFADIDASFSGSVEQMLITEICRRLRAVGITGDIHHSEDMLAWYMPPAAERELDGHFEGLKAIMIAPVILGARRVDLLVTFGADSDFASPVSSRVGSAIMSATEAVDESRLWKHYAPERRDNADWELSLLGRLDEGIDNGEVWVAFQPQYDFTKKCIIGAEALVRWDHPDRGPISPEEFVLAAERHNRIDKLTWFVLDRAISAAAGINRRGVEFTISVNVSASVLRSPQLLRNVRDILGRHGFPAGKLVLEITETGRISDMTAALDVMHALVRMGVRLSIDDYGTGFASLDYFRVIPATEIKIDRRFISNLRPGAAEMVLVASTIAMAHSMGCSVVAEGIEHQGEFDVLAISGCDLGQGYLIGKPVTPDILIENILPERLRRSA